MKKWNLASIAALAFVCSSSTALADDDDMAGGLGYSQFLRLSAGYLRSEVAPTAEEGQPMPAEFESSNTLMFHTDVSGLLFPSTTGNLHGFEVFSTLMLFPFDIDVALGTSVTMLKLGSGGTGTLVIGGGFGAGLSYRHGYGYLRGRVAAVIVPKQIEIEGSLQWIPEAASATYSGDGDFEQLFGRASVFYRFDPEDEDSKALEVYLQYFERDRRGHNKMADPSMPFDGLDVTDEVSGFGLGVGLNY